MSQIPPTSAWFANHSGANHGPIPFSQLQQIFSQGAPPETPVWTEGLQAWIPALQVPGLVPTPQAAAPAFTPQQAPSAQPYPQQAAVPQAPQPATQTAPAQAEAGFQAQQPSQQDLAPAEPKRKRIATSWASDASASLPSESYPLDFKFCLVQGFKQTIANIVPILKLLAVFIGITFILNFALSFILGMVAGPSITTPDPAAFTPPTMGPDGQMPDMDAYLAASQNTASAGLSTTYYIGMAVVQLIQNAVIIFLTMGGIYAGFQLLLGNKISISMLFSQKSKFLKGFLASLIFAFIVGIGYLCLIIPGIFLTLRLGFFLPAIVEKDLGIIESLKYSFGLTKENTFPLLVLFIAGCVLLIIGVIALLLGSLIAIPTFGLAVLIAYRYLHTGESKISVLS